MANVWAFKDESLYKFNQTGKASKEWNRSAGVWLWVVNYMGPKEKEDAFITALQSDANPPEDIKVDEDGEVVTIQAKYPAQTSDTNNNGGSAPDPIFAAWTMTANVANAPLIEDPRFLPIKGGDGIERGFTKSVVAAIQSQVLHYKSKKRREADDKNDGDLTMVTANLSDFTAEVRKYCQAAFANFDADLRAALVTAWVRLHTSSNPSPPPTVLLVPETSPVRYQSAPRVVNSGRTRVVLMFMTRSTCSTTGPWARSPMSLTCSQRPWIQSW
jgi:hypothetical protein